MGPESLPGGTRGMPAEPTADTALRERSRRQQKKTSGAGTAIQSASGPTGERTFCASYVAAYKLQSAMLRNFAGGRSLFLRRGLIVVAVRVWTAIGVVVAAARTEIKRV